MSAKPYHVKAGSGRTYDVGIPITVKAGERGTGNGAAVIEFEARRGEEPGRIVTTLKMRCSTCWRDASR
jgi:hypothetical protein